MTRPSSARRAAARRWSGHGAVAAGALLALSAAGCEASTPGTGGAAATGGEGGSGGVGGLGGSGGGDGCACLPGGHNERIYVMSAAAELWSFDTEKGLFEFVADAACDTAESPYSMAVDRAGRAWILFSESQDLRTLDVNAPGECGDPGFTPRQAGFGLFGMAFAGNGPDDECAQLYMLSYSGQGPFGEGPGAGTLGVIDPATATAKAIGPIDFNGGELSGTADGRLFAFAGKEPAKLVEYNKSTAKVTKLTPLDGFHKTNASAFAMFRGDIYFFTEAPPADCAHCLAASCGDVYSSCAADPACAAEIDCALALGDIMDDCGGAMPEELKGCLFGPCSSQCFPPPEDRLSQVSRLARDAEPGSLTVVAQAPIRIVGAGVSTCVDQVPR